MNIKTVNFVFGVGFLLIVASHSLFSTGLSFDGSIDLLQMILRYPIHYHEYSRRFFQVFYQLPAWILVEFSTIQSISILTKVWSFSLMWIHVISLFGCWFVLPKDKKHFIFFPFFGFFTGPALSLTISISVALSVCSYVWMTAFFIYYLDLRKKVHKLLFFLAPLPLLLSHELMSYMAWPLIALCLYKHRKEKNLFNKRWIGLIAAYLLIVSLVQVSMLFFNKEIRQGGEHFDQFLKNLIDLTFLIRDGGINFPLFVSVFTLLLSFLPLFIKNPLRDKILKSGALVLCFTFIGAFIISVFGLSTDSFNNIVPLGYIRIYPPIVGLPLGLLIWFLYEKKKENILKTKNSLFLCWILYCLFMVFVCISFDLRFHKYRKSYSKILDLCEGVIDKTEDLQEHLERKYSHRMLFVGGIERWNSFPSSILFIGHGNIKSVLLGCPPLCCLNDCESIFLESCKKNRCNYKKDVYPMIKRLHETRFFDASVLMKNILNDMSECKI